MDHQLDQAVGTVMLHSPPLMKWLFQMPAQQAHMLKTGPKVQCLRRT